jgi:hypothetical protein
LNAISFPHFQEARHSAATHNILGLPKKMLEPTHITRLQIHQFVLECLYDVKRRNEPVKQIMF